MRTVLNWLREMSKLFWAMTIALRLTVQPKFLSRGWVKAKFRRPV